MTTRTPIPAGFVRAIEEIYPAHYARIVAEAEVERCRREWAAWQPAAHSPLEWGAPVRPTSIRAHCFGEVPYPPPRANAPRAGDAGYEPGDAPLWLMGGRTRIALAIFAAALVLALAAALRVAPWR